MKKLLFLCLTIIFLPCASLQLNPEKLNNLRNNLDKSKNQIEKVELQNMLLSLAAGAISKIALLASIACMTNNNYKFALAFGGVAGVSEACSNLAAWQVVHKSQEKTVILIAENILVSMSECITK